MGAGILLSRAPSLRGPGRARRGGNEPRTALAHGECRLAAAGVPTYLGLFGRDALCTAWQAGMLGPEMLRGALHALARTQGRKRNDWRDEQPGRMIHEMHTGPRALLNFNPKARYYGGVTG